MKLVDYLTEILGLKLRFANQKHFGIIKSFPENFLVSTGFAVLDVNEKIAFPDFVYYYLIQNENTESLHAIAEQTTSAYPAIKPSDIADISIILSTLLSSFFLQFNSNYFALKFYKVEFQLKKQHQNNLFL